jgi:hypothetical protein
MKSTLKSLIFKKNSLGKILITLFACWMIPCSSFAGSKWVKGYIISQNNDTLRRQLEVEADLFGQFNELKLFHQVTIIQESGVPQILTPADIRGFGFNYKDRQYSFISKPIDKEGKLLFVEPIVSGRKATLYLYKELSYMTNEYHFTVEKQDGTYICLSDFSALDSFRENLKSFFMDEKDALALIEGSFHSRSKIEKDVTKIVQEVNIDKKSLLATRQ